MKNKNILVVGGQKGIGLIISRHIVNDLKFNTVITSRKKLRKNFFKNHFEFFKLDLCKLNNLIKFNKFLKLNNISDFHTVVICSGTLGKIEKFKNIKLKSLKKTFQVNLFGQFQLCQFLLKKKLLRSKSNLIFLSTSLCKPDPYFLEYTTSKHAQYALMLTLSEELKKKKIFFNCLMPGQFHTDMNQKKINFKNKINDKIYKNALKVKKTKPIKKIKSLEKTIDLLINHNNKLQITGRIISAQHDNWKRLLKKNKRFFTFRRIF